MAHKFFERLQNVAFFLGRRVIQLFIIAFLFGILWFAVESSFVFILQGFLLSLGIMPAEKAILPDWYPRSLVTSVLLLLSFGLARSFLSASREFFLGITRYSFIRHQRTLFFSYSIHHAHEVDMSTLLTLYNERMSQAAAVLNQCALLLNSGISFLLFFVFGLGIAAKELLVGIAMLGILLIPFRYLNRKSLEYGKTAVVNWDQTYASFLTGLKNHFFLKVYNLIDYESAKGAIALRKLELLYRKNQFISSIRFAYPQFAGIVTVCTMTYVGLHFLETPGTKLLALFYIFIRLSQSASEVYSAVGEINFNKEGVRHLFHWFLKASNYDHRHKIEQHAEQQVEFQDQPVQIKLENLDFAFPDKAPLFRNFSLTLGHAELLLVQGQSGSGKSTLISLILGLLEPTKGSVQINGTRIKSIKNSFVPYVGYVGPEPYLVPATIRQNLLYGHPQPQSVTEAELWRVLDVAQLSDHLRTLKDGLNEQLNESAQLSTGQRQRLAIARAVLRRPRLLILDEATANLDSATEQKFIEILKTLKKDLTVIVISHKGQFHEIADQVLRLGNMSQTQGKVGEYGN